MSDTGLSTLALVERGIAAKSRELRDDMRALAEGGAFYRTKSLNELRAACAAFVGADEHDTAALDRLMDALDRYQISRPDWEATKE